MNMETDSEDFSMTSTGYDPKKIGKKIRTRLKQLGLKKGEFARRVGRHPVRVSNWLNGKGLPDTETLLRICYILDVPFDWLTNGEDKVVIRTPEERGVIEDFESLLKLHDPEILRHLTNQLRLLVELVRRREQS